MTIPEHKAYSSSTQNITTNVKVASSGVGHTVLPILTIDGDIAVGTANSPRSFISPLAANRYTPDDVWAPAEKDEPELWAVWVNAALQNEAIVAILKTVLGDEIKAPAIDRLEMLEQRIDRLERRCA